ncbi:MAG: carboxypeptidase-like regulatory domain-containing protein, partial [Candidatus Desantisbacteria bacterium]
MKQIIFKMIMLSILIAQPLQAQGLSAASLSAATNEGTITGRVTDESDKAIAGVSIYVLDYHTTTDDTGCYMIKGLPLGTHSMEIRPTGNLIDQDISISINESGTVTLNIILTQGGIIKGKITDELGTPIGGVFVRVTDNSKSTKTNSDGRYELQGLPNGRYGIEVYFRSETTSLRYRVEDLLVASGSITTQDITLHKSGVISGVVLDISDNPIIGARVDVWDNRCQSQGYVQTDSNGQYTIKGLSTGIYTVAASPPSSNHDLAPLRIEGVSITKDNITVQNLILPIAGTLTGYIKDKMGNPVANAW